MGATITTGKRASAFAAPGGQIIYCLWEKSYEKNVYPHVSQWSAVILGTYEQVLRWIFLGAASCASGMLRSTRGDIDPQNYIDAWAREMAKPFPLPDQDVVLYCGAGWSAPLPQDRRGAAEKLLTDAGRHDIAQALAADQKVALRLHGDAAALASLYGSGELGAWRILTRMPEEFDAPRDPSLAPAQRRGALVVPVVRAWKLDQDNLVISFDDGDPKLMGWRYSATGTYLMQRVYQAELVCTGATKRFLAQWNQAVDAAAPLPGAARLHIKRGAGSTADWAWLRLCAKLEATGRPIHGDVELTLDEAQALEVIHEIRYHSPDCVRIELPKPAASSIDFSTPAWPVPQPTRLTGGNLPLTA